MRRHKATAGGGEDVGVVTVSVGSCASPAEVWEALTSPAAVGRWFGVLSPGLNPGGRALLDFGDGDFFTLEEIKLNPPHRLQYQWRFLGTGPLDTITWQISAQDLGCQITVTDTEPERSREAALELRQGWLDFSARLQRFLRYHEDARYTCRSEFEGSVELPANLQTAWGCLSANETQPLWLPLDGAALRDGAHLTLIDGAEPLRVELMSVACEPLTGYHFKLKHPFWVSPMDCSLELTPRRNDTLLKVRHNGWWGRLNSGDERERLHQRRRFSALWVAALRQARWLVEQTQNAKTEGAPKAVSEASCAD